MKISTKGRYGLRIMMELALRHGQGPVLVDTIEQRQGISGKYIHQLMLGLKHAGLIRTVRGPRGGYELLKPPAEITAFEVISVLEGPLLPVECLTLPVSCERAGACVTRDLWGEVAAAVEDVLSATTLETLCRRLRALEESQSSFCI